METEQVLKQAQALRERIQTYIRDRRGGSNREGSPQHAAKAQVSEFLRQYAGPKSAFVRQADEASGYDTAMIATLTAIIDAFIEYVKAGLATGLSPERQAQIDVVSDILGQAQMMLENKEYHPAAPAVLIGASLEEFLRNWVEAAGLSIGNAKPGIDAYSKALRTAEMISKQDVKDITSWAGIRNHAAHGEWDELKDPARVRIMLDGVNLFMRQNTPK